MAPGFLPFLLWMTPHHHPFSSLELGVITTVVVILGTAFFFCGRSLLRRGEKSPGFPVFIYAFIFLFPLFLFPDRSELAMSVVAIVAFGDGVATLAGLKTGRSPLPWNPDKTWAGLFAFIIAGWPMATLVYWGETFPVVSLSESAAITLGVVIISAFAESLDTKVNDNLVVGMTSLTVLWIFQAFFENFLFT